MKRWEMGAFEIFEEKRNKFKRTMGIEISAETADVQMPVDIESKRDYLNKRTLNELITIC